MSATAFPPVQQRLMEFLRHTFQLGYNHYNVQKLIGDASARQYFRLAFENDGSYVLAAYPEPFRLEDFNYQKVYDLFRKVGLPVPVILRADGDLGVVLQEDLGDESLQKRLRSGGPGEHREWLCRAIDLLVTIQSEGTQAADPESDAHRQAFDEEKLSWELEFFRRNYGAYRQLPLVENEELRDEFARLAGELACYPRFLCHRDYHVRNLMLKNEQLFIIDFQDARQGPASYDLVSLLKDSIQLSPEEVDGFIDYYLAQVGSRSVSPGDRTEFRRQFDLMSIQRLLKALGTYGYQIMHRGNFIYEQYVAGSLHRTALALRSIDEFPYIQTLVEGEMMNFQTTGSVVRQE